MVYFVTNDTVSWQAKRGFLDTPLENPLWGLRYEQPGEIELRAPEREHRYTIGHGYRVAADGLIFKAQWLPNNAEYDIPDIASMQGQTIVSERFKALVEQFEPHVHQFIPVDIYRHPKEQPYARYYALNVCNRIDSTDADAMKRNGWHTILDYAGGRSQWLHNLHEMKPPIVFNLNQIAGQYLWVDTYLHPYGDFYVADAFVDAAQSQGLTGLLLVQHEEV